MFRAILILTSATLLSGCAAAVLGAGSFIGVDEMGKGAMGKAERRQATIAALGSAGKDLVARHIEIEDVKKDNGMESWTAETVIGNYRCSVATGRSDATCSKIG